MRNTPPDRVRLGEFEVDLRAGELRAGNGPIYLQEQPLFVLRLLVERAGDLVTRDEIQQKLWPNDTVVDFDHGINAAIRRLRLAFGDSAEEPAYIATIARRGYRLLVSPEPVSAPGEAGTSNSNGPADTFRASTASGKTADNAGLIGKKVSHYRVLQVIGAGGMGLVYEAEDLKLGRRVALKFLPEELARDADALQRFEREARAASSLDHPNICTIYEIEEHEAQPFIVMQLLQGETLRDRLASLAATQKNIPLPELLDIAGQICLGLEVAHEKGIIHRDIKPANIFLTAHGPVKILDFGLAKLVEAEERHMAAAAAGSETSRVVGHDLTVAGLTMGTAGYMSPEQVRGEKLDTRTDLFSFGLVLYEMATGQRAFTGKTAKQIEKAIVNEAPLPVCQCNSAVPTGLEQIINRAMQKTREQRYQSAAELALDLGRLADRFTKAGVGKFLIWKWLGIASLICGLVAAAAWYSRLHSRPRLTEHDTIVLADFDNRTGDPLFDDTLKQALSFQLEQSPFLNVLSDRKVGATLKLMNRPRTAPLTEGVAREVCIRTSSKAVLAGSIAKSGQAYVVALKAVGCSLEDSLAETREQAANKEVVLTALDRAATTMRRSLGESLSSVETYATPLPEVTTPSLEALQAYSLARKTNYAKGQVAALPDLERAVEIDPNFAVAYSAIGVVDRNLGKVAQATENSKKAYELRQKVSERERFIIEADYYRNVTGELEKAAQIYERWQQIYPSDYLAFLNLGNVYASLGNLAGTARESQDAMRLEPNNVNTYIDAGVGYMSMNRLEETEDAFKQAQQRGLQSGNLLLGHYSLAFITGDTGQMAQTVAAAMGKPGVEDSLLASQADTEGWYGKLNNARKLTQRAIESARQNGAQETAAGYQASEALREAAAGNADLARKNARLALNLAQNRDIKALAGLALAKAGDSPQAKQLAAELGMTFPLDTLVQRYWLPTITAAIALQEQDPKRAAKILETARDVELGQPTMVGVLLCPVYIRGEAYLMIGDGNAAAAEFQKFIDHYGLVGNFPWGALARLGIARAFALQAQSDPAARERALSAYQDFLALWKNADPDIPIYKQAKTEYAKLR